MRNLYINVTTFVFFNYILLINLESLLAAYSSTDTFLDSGDFSNFESVEYPLESFEAASDSNSNYAIHLPKPVEKTKPENIPEQIQLVNTKKNTAAKVKLPWNAYGLIVSLIVTTALFYVHLHGAFINFTYYAFLYGVALSVYFFIDMIKPLYPNIESSSHLITFALGALLILQWPLLGANSISLLTHFAIMLMAVGGKITVALNVWKLFMDYMRFVTDLVTRITLSLMARNKK